MDFMDLMKGMNFLIVTDAYIKSLEVFLMISTISKEIEKRLQDMFSRFGLPEIVATEITRSFVSRELRVFFERNGKKSITSPSFHPESNGVAENSQK